MERIRILVVDHHAVFRQGLIKLFESSRRVQVVGEAGSGPEAEARARELRPEIVLMDLRMPGQDGIETARHIIGDRAEMKVLFLTASESATSLFEAMRAGACGYLVKTLTFEEIEEAISAVFHGQTVISPASLTAQLLAEILAPRDAGGPVGTVFGDLSSREKEILRLVASGARNREVASQLCIAETTVKTHLRNILDKLHIQNRVELALVAHRKGWVPHHN